MVSHVHSVSLTIFWVCSSPLIIIFIIRCFAVFRFQEISIDGIQVFKCVISDGMDNIANIIYVVVEVLFLWPKGWSPLKVFIVICWEWPHSLLFTYHPNSNLFLLWNLIFHKLLGQYTDTGFLAWLEHFVWAQSHQDPSVCPHGPSW